MSDVIRVRLVPKNKKGDSIILEDFTEVIPRLAKEFSPDAERATEAFRMANNLGIDAEITPNNSLTGIVPKETFKSLFHIELVEPEKTTVAHAYRTSEERLIVREALEIPEELRDTIAYAYVPTPPIFTAISFVPPNISLYHLRLSDVLRGLNGSQCHRRGWTGRSIKLAMTDTGFANHPYFSSNGYNIIRVATPASQHPLVDSSGHGTAESANALVIAPDCQFIGVKHNEYSAEVLEITLAQRPQIVINAWGWDIDYRSKDEFKRSFPNHFLEIIDIENIVNDAIDDGVTMIFSAGNGHKLFPASMPNVLAIGGVTVEQNGKLKASNYASSFRSSFYPGRRVPDVCGIVGEKPVNNRSPKGHIILPVPNGCEMEGENMPKMHCEKGWCICSGTSAAAPQIGGVVSLMLSINPNLTPSQIKSILSDTATDVERGQTAMNDLAISGFNNATGAGFVNAFQACLRVERFD